MSSTPSSSPSPSSSLHLPHSSLFLSPDPATATSSSTDPAAATSSPTDLAAAPSSSMDLAVERPDPTVDLHHGHDAGIHHGHDAGTSTTAGEDASVRRDPRGGVGVVPCERLARWLRPWEARIRRRWARQWARERAHRRAPVFFVFFKMINRSGHPNVPAVVKVYLPRRARYTTRHGKSVNRGGQGRPPRLSHDLPWPLGRGGRLCPPRKTENARLQ